MKRSRRQKAIIKRRIFISIFILIMVVLIGLIGLTINYLLKSGKDKNGNSQTKTSSSDNQSETSSVTIPETQVTVINTGDIIVHSPQLDGAYNKSTGEYDFSAFFKHVSPYFKKYDLAVANLEVTFGGTESGKYKGYPSFNTPDSLADVIKQSGLNLLLTSNNHAYDTGLFGLKRTVQVLNQKEIEHTGTRELETEPHYIIKTINNIKIGIADFTYETDGKTAGRKYLNGNIIAESANNLINSFSYSRIDDFYNESQTMINDMKSSGADYIIFYMHWGNEYQSNANTWQKTIAQKLSNFGVNMIIGSHPHVIQPIDIIKPEGSDNSTICLYSMGNCISNQRQEIMTDCPNGSTEDGMLYSFTLKKSSEGTVLTDLNIIPTWVDKYRGGSGYQYTVYPLESEDDGVTKFSLSGTAATKSKNSYKRTKTVISEGLTRCQQEIGCNITFK